MDHLWTDYGRIFWVVGACKCETRKALDFATPRFGTRSY